MSNTMLMTPNGALFSVDEAAEFLSVCTKTVRRQAASGKLERRQFAGDRRVYVTAESVVRALASRELQRPEQRAPGALFETVRNLESRVAALEGEPGRGRGDQECASYDPEIARIVRDADRWHEENIGPRDEEPLPVTSNPDRMKWLRRWHPELFADEDQLPTGDGTAACGMLPAGDAR